MYEDKFELTDGTVLTSKQVTDLNKKAIDAAVRYIAAQNTKIASKGVAVRK